MSKTIISIERVNEVMPHPNADRLDIIQVLGYQVVVLKDSLKVGDDIIYFPPDILLPPHLPETLGVSNYLKHSVFPGETEKRQCRVAATRLRGVPSHGFTAPLSAWCGETRQTYSLGADLTDVFDAVKYVPPVRLGAGDAAAELPTFHKYTDIENIQRYPDVIEEGALVVITEKIHGTNCRLGLVRDNSGEHIFCAGSHNIRRKGGLYWEFMSEKMKDMLSLLSDHNELADVVVFGEIFGKGIQDLQYGMLGPAFRVFDISMNGEYLDYQTMLNICAEFKIGVVPELYRGPFSQEILEEHTNGDSRFKVTGKFRGREGCVIRPEVEQVDVLGNRVVLKSISVDYLDRKGAKDLS